MKHVAASAPVSDSLMVGAYGLNTIWALNHLINRPNIFWVSEWEATASEGKERLRVNVSDMTCCSKWNRDAMWNAQANWKRKKKKNNTESCVAAGLKPFRLKGRHDFELNWRGSVWSELEEKQDAILKKELDWVILLQVQILPGHRRHSEHIRALASVHSVLLAHSLHYLTRGNPLINPGSTYFSGKWSRLRIHHPGLAFANTAPTVHSNSGTSAN